jgi:hypothetical protein
VHDAGQDEGGRPDLTDRVGQALQPVADQHQHILDAAVLDLGEDLQPELRALAALAGPQAEDVAGALGGDGQGHVDGAVDHRAVADLDVDGVDEDDRVDGVQRPVLPLGHAVHDLVGDRGDRLAGDLHAIDLRQVGLDLAGGQALRGQGDDDLVDP